MATIIIKAKVKLPSEAQIEMADKDMGDMPWIQSEGWVWRRMGIDANDISKVISHSPDKCIVKEYSGEVTLVKEKFKDLYKKWSENISSDISEIEFESSEEDVNNEDGED